MNLRKAGAGIRNTNASPLVAEGRGGAVGEASGLTVLVNVCDFLAPAFFMLRGAFSRMQIRAQIVTRNFRERFNLNNPLGGYSFPLANRLTFNSKVPGKRRESAYFLGNMVQDRWAGRCNHGLLYRAAVMACQARLAVH